MILLLGEFSCLESWRGRFSPKITATPHENHHETPHEELSLQMAALLSVFRGEMGRDELLAALGLKDRKNLREVYLKPALADGIIEMSRPDALQSKRQTYRLTEKGKALFQDGQ